MEDNIKNFLEKIEGIRDKKSKVFIFSSGKEEEATPLTFKQQKDLISTIADGTIGSLKFQKILNRIVLDNTCNEDLKTIDRLAIILKLRSESLGEEVKIGETKVKLQKFLDKIKKKSPIKLSYTIVGDIQVILEIPLITYENQIIQSTIDGVKKDGDELGKNISNIYTYEIVKYIKSVEFDGNVINFPEISIKDRVKIVDNLPISINQKIVNYIQDIKKIENEWLTVEVGGEKKILDIDVSFFDS